MSINIAIRQLAENILCKNLECTSSALFEIQYLRAKPFTFLRPPEKLAFRYSLFVFSLETFGEYAYCYTLYIYVSLDEIPN